MSTRVDTPRRDRILSAAASEFARHGAAGARVERIAAAAGVNKQLLFHYFGSKSGLYLAALKSMLERSVSAGQPSRAPVERLRDLSDQLAAVASSHPALLTLLASPAGEPDAAAIAEAWLDGVRRQALGILQDGQRSGYIRDDAEIDAVAELIVAATLGWTSAGDRGTAGRREAARDTLLRMAMDYCAWR